MTQSLKDLELEQDFFATNALKVQHWLPWLRLFRAFRMSIDYRRMVVAVVAVIVWSAGLHLLDWLLPPPEPTFARSGLATPLPRMTLTYADGQQVPMRDADLFPGLALEMQRALQPRQALWPWEPGALPSTLATSTRVNLSSFVHSPWRTLTAAFSNGTAILWPAEQLLTPGRQVLKRDIPYTRWTSSILAVGWGLIVCGLFGGAIARMAAVDFAGRGELSVVRSLGYSTRRTFSYLGAPLIPLVGLAACWIPNLIAGVIARFPVLGDGVVGAVWILPLISGTLMALIVAGVTVGWPLMIAAISTEGGDAFDGLSRAYSYVFNQLWYLLFQVGFLLLYGSATLYLVCGMLGLAVDLTVLSVESGLGDIHNTSLMPADAVNPLWQDYLSSRRGGDDYRQDVGRVGVSIWMRILGSIPAAFIFSFFWTAATMVYFLLRLRDDATPLTSVGAMPEDAVTAPFPLVGMPAAELREKDLSGQTPSPDGAAPNDLTTSSEES